MKLLAFIAFLLGSLLGVNSVETFGARVQLIEIYPAEENSTIAERVFGYTSCGGPGTVLDYRIENCEANTTCTFPVEVIRQTEIDFIPSQDISQVGVRFHMLESNGKFRKVLEKPIEDSPVDGGTRYRVRIDGTPTKEYKGKRITFFWIMYRVEDNSIETCIQAEFEFV